jgi:hypothetical protein
MVHSSIFGFMHEFWTIPIDNLTYIRLQNYTNFMVGKHRIQTFNVVVVMLILLLLLHVFIPTSAHPLLYLNKWFVQKYVNISFGEHVGGELF